MGLCLCPASLMRTFYCSTFNRSMLLILREKFTELCACSKCLFPISPHWLTCMENPMHIGPRLAVNFRHCPLEKTSTASAATHTSALALDHIGSTKPLTEKKVHLAKKERKVHRHQEICTFTSVKKVDYL